MECLARHLSDDQKALLITTTEIKCTIARQAIICLKNDHTVPSNEKQALLDKTVELIRDYSQKLAILKG